MPTSRARAYRRRGIATRLLRSLGALARQHGLQCLYLHVHRDNEPATRLYLSLGYACISATTDDECLVMRKELGGAL